MVRWIQNFLHNRKYCVVANGMMSDKHDVISGVPQGTVLASLFFIIMIADMDENLKVGVGRLFADDTKVSAKIKTQEDIRYDWHSEILDYHFYEYSIVGSSGEYKVFLNF